MEPLLEFISLFGETLVARLHRFIQAKNMAPVAVGARIVIVLNWAIEGKVEAANLAEMVSFHVSSYAGQLRSLVGIVHPVEIFDRVFDHPRFLGQDIPEKLFHGLYLVRFAFVWQSIFKGGDEFHGEMGIPGLDA